MGCTLSKCWCPGRRKQRKQAQTLSSATDHVTKYLEPLNNNNETLFAATDVKESLELVFEGDAREELAKTSPSAATEDHDVTETFESVCKTALKLFKLNHDNVQEFTSQLSDKPELVSFIKDYLKTSIQTLDLFTFLEDCLLKAQSTVELAGKAVYDFEQGLSAGAVVRALYSLVDNGKTFQPFPKSKEVELQRLCERHHSGITKLSERKKVLDEKLGSIEYWKTVTSCIGYVCNGILIIGAMVLTIMTGSDAALTVLELAGGAIPKVVNKMISSFFHNSESFLEGERDTIIELRKQTSIAIHDLNNINALVKEFERCVGSLNWYEIFPVVGEEKEGKVITAMYAIQTKAEGLKDKVNEMKRAVRKLRQELRAAVAVGK